MCTLLYTFSLSVFFSRINREMQSKQLSSQVSLFLSSHVETVLSALNVSSFSSKSFSPSIPHPGNISNAFVDTTNWFAFVESGLIPSTKYLLGGKQDRFFRDRIASNSASVSIETGILCMNAGSSNNYYHWLIQTILSLAGYQTHIDVSVPILVSRELSRYQLEWLDIIGVNKRRLHSFPGATTLEVRSLFVLPTLYKPYDFHPCTHLINVVRDLVCANENLDKEDRQDTSKLYISRSDSRKPRGVHLEDVLEDFLKSHGYAIVKMADYTISQQISMISSADTIIAPHGAGLANIILTKPGCNILEINNEDYVNTCFSRLWEAMECSTGQYRHLVCAGFNNMASSQGETPSYHQSKCIVDFEEILDIV
jgi:capsular polysaccharide biosynthesis protein